MTLLKLAGLAALLFAFPSFALAQSTLNSGDTAWMLTATALVLFMTIPGLALFYAGMVRAKNVLSIMMQCFCMSALISLLWIIYGYSLAFDTTGMEEGVLNLHSFIGSFSNVFLNQLTLDSLTGSFPESVFVVFQMTFAILTPALIVGAFAERIKFLSLLVFVGFWFTLVYLPIAHMVWSGDGALMDTWGVIDFAGGTVVHINAGVAGLVACILVGKRHGYPTIRMAPHNLGYTLIGAAMLWVGWFGFNAGSAAAAGAVAGMAMLVTQAATASAVLAWIFIEWWMHGKPTALGAASGAIAGLVAITPAAGTAGPMGAIAIGLTSGVICFFTATTIKRKLGYDDSLDVFGVHGVGGIVGALLTAVFASPLFGGFGDVMDITRQIGVQFLGVVITVIYGGLVSYLLLKIIDRTLGLRVSLEIEEQGLDLAEHNERGYNL